MVTIYTKITDTFTFPSGVNTTITIHKNLNRDMQLSKNFKLYELANNLATDKVKAIYNPLVKEHNEMLQELRDMIGVMNVTSWYRTPDFNASCGGNSNSLHLNALATDVKYPNMTDAFYQNILSVWKGICARHNKIGGINRYTNGVHLSSHEEYFGYKNFVTRDYRGSRKNW